jgi:hypothetical protein
LNSLNTLPVSGTGSIIVMLLLEDSNLATLSGASGLNLGLAVSHGHVRFLEPHRILRLTPVRGLHQAGPAGISW